MTDEENIIRLEKLVLEHTGAIIEAREDFKNLTEKWRADKREYQRVYDTTDDYVKIMANKFEYIHARGLFNDTYFKLAILIKQKRDARGSILREIEKLQGRQKPDDDLFA